MVGKDVRGGAYQLLEGTVPALSLKELRKAQDSINQNSWCPRQDKQGQIEEAVIMVNEIW
jgi:hypothetical protein